jgi:hypothetical protein
LLHRSARNIDFWRLRALSSGVIILRVKRAKQNMTSRKIRMVGAEPRQRDVRAEGPHGLWRPESGAAGTEQRKILMVDPR